MNRLSRVAIPLALVAFATARADSGTATKPLPPPTKFDLKAIDAYVESQLPAKGYVGLSLAIMRDVKIVFAKGYGNRSLEPVAPVEVDTPFAIGSITKQFACACILLLAEDGKLSVQDSV